VLPAIALAVLATLHGPADGGHSGGCGAVRSADPGIRASFQSFHRNQSATAAKICQLASNNLP